MIILGWLLSIGGAIATIAGMVSYNNASSAGYGLYRYADSSDIDSARMIIIIGAVALVLGVAFLVIGYIKRSSKKGTSVRDRLATHKCLKCGSILPNDVRFCPNCGNDINCQ